MESTKADDLNDNLRTSLINEGIEVSNMETTILERHVFTQQ